MAHAMHVRILNMEGHIAEKGMLESLRILYIHDLLFFFLFFSLFPTFTFLPFQGM